MMLATFGLLFVQATPATDWPQFRGPLATGEASTEGVDLAFDWPEHGPDVLWVREIGPGYGGVAVRDGKVFLFDREVGSRDVLRVFDLETAEEEWTSGYDSPGRLQYSGSRCVPTVTETHVYTQGGFGRLTCWDRTTREEAWSVDLEEVYGGVMPAYGWSCSPLLVDDMIVITALGEEVGLVAFDAATGDERWVTPPAGRSHSTPVLMDLLGKQQIVFLSTMGPMSANDVAAPTTITSFDPEFGDLLWQTETLGSFLTIPGPMQIDQERFFLTGGYRGGSTMLRIREGEDGYSFEELFRIDRGAQVHFPVRHGDHLYVLVNENWNDTRARRKEGGLLCLGLDGTEVWRTGDTPYFGRGPILLIGDHLLIQDGYDGTLRAVRATPDGYTPVAEANLFGIDDRADHQMWAPMALADGYLLLRSQEELLCVDI